MKFQEKLTNWKKQKSKLEQEIAHHDGMFALQSHNKCTKNKKH